MDPKPGNGSDRSPVVAEFLAAGREPHLHLVAETIDRTVAGASGVLLVGGDPGTGKTWLIEKACRHALDRHPDLTVLWTRCISRFAIGPALEPFRQMLGLMTGDVDTLSPRERLSDRNAGIIISRIPTAVRTLVEDTPDLIGWLMPVGGLTSARVHAAIGNDLQHRLEIVLRLRTERTHDTDAAETLLSRMLAGYAKAGPAVLVIEDLQRADPATLAVLGRLASSPERIGGPVLVIGSARPNDPAEDGDVIRAHLERAASAHRLVDLATAVGGSAGRAFLDGMLASRGLGGDPARSDALFARTAGLSYFVASYLRLRESGNAGDPSALGDTVPAEIESIFAQQLYRLAPEV